MIIQEVADKTGLSAHTLRYYERAELIPPINRADNGHRTYTKLDLDWIHFVQCLRNTGMSISNIRCYMRLAIEGEHTNEARLQLLAEHRDLVLCEIEELKQNLKALDAKIAFYESVVQQQEN